MPAVVFAREEATSCVCARQPSTHVLFAIDTVPLLHAWPIDDATTFSKVIRYAHEGAAFSAVKHMSTAKDSTGLDYAFGVLFGAYLLYCAGSVPQQKLKFSVSTKLCYCTAE